MQQYGDQIEFFKEMQQRGHKVPALDKKPVVPSYLQIVMRMHADLTRDGSITFSDYCMWCDRFGVRGFQFEYLWEVLGVAHSTVYEWKQKRDESSSKNSGKTTGGT